MDAAIQTYMEEAREVLTDMEEALLDLETSPENAEIISRVFRGLHTIKGSGAMFGFDEIARFTHDVETVFDRVRNGELAVSRDLLSLTFSAKDHLERLLKSTQQGTDEDRAASDELLVKFSKYLAGGGQDDKAEAAPASQADKPAEGGSPETFWIRYRPPADTFFTGSRPLQLLEELDELGDTYVVFHDAAIPALDALDSEKAWGWWDVLLHTKQGENAVRDVFIFVADDGGVEIRRVGVGGIRDSDVETLTTLFTGSDEMAYDAVCSEVNRLYTNQIRKRGTVPPKDRRTEPHPEAAPAASVRVDASRLDEFVDMVGELVTLQSRLTLAVNGLNNPVLEQLAEDMERLTDTMRDNALSIRMLPIGTVFNTFRRLVRDLSGSLGKKVEFVTKGAETELDKTVLDKLKDPLMHILRNSLDHGLESSARRTQTGKSETGTVLLEAEHSCGEVLIKVHDDGAGIDPDKILAKAVERGLVTGDEDLPAKDILGLIFEPGFSTAEQISDVSGRGVGMDVVKKGIDALRGHVEIESELGVGTTIVIRLPLTLSIIEGLAVRVGQESYIVPLSIVEACQERFMGDGAARTFDTMERRGKMIPCISLRKMLEVPGEQPDYEQIIIVGNDGSQVGLAVDEVVGRQQAVIKSLGEVLKAQKWVSGTAINGDGTISLIMDVPQLIRFAEHRFGKATPREKVA